MSGPPYEQASGMPECDVKHPLGMNNISIINSKYVIPFSVIINPSLGRDTRVENRGHRLSSSCVQFFFAFQDGDCKYRSGVVTTPLSHEGTMITTINGHI